MAAVEETTEVVKWFTHARKFPALIGRTSDGKRIPGGPYTPTQLIVAAVVAWLASKTTWVWARFDRVGDLVVFAVLVGAPVFLLGRLPIGSRNPVRVLAGAVAAVTTPRGGRINGSPVRPPKRSIAGGPVAIPAVPAPLPPAPPRTVVLSPIQAALASPGRSVLKEAA